MSTNQSNAVDSKHAELVKKFYQAILIGDWNVIAQCVTPNFKVQEAEGLPFRGNYCGLEELKSLFGTLCSYWDNLSIVVRAVTAGDGVAVGVLQFSGRAKATGRELSFPIAEIIEFENDLISNFCPVYWDTKALSEAVGA